MRLYDLLWNERVVGKSVAQLLAEARTETMFRVVVPLIVAATVWYGSATWYGHPFIGRYTRSGELYTGKQMTGAVSSDLWEAMQGRVVTVCTAEKCIKVKVTDSGDADAFRAHGVAIDLSPRAFRELAPLSTGRVEVSVWAK